jgi:hypothetical protein
MVRTETLQITAILTLAAAGGYLYPCPVCGEEMLVNEAMIDPTSHPLLLFLLRLKKHFSLDKVRSIGKAENWYGRTAKSSRRRRPARSKSKLLVSDSFLHQEKV